MQTTACSATMCTSLPSGGDSASTIKQFVHADFVDLLRRNGLDAPLALLTLAGERLSKPGLHAWRERLRVRLADTHCERVLYLKRFRQALMPWPFSGLGRARLGPFGRGMADLERFWIAQLSAAGIPCPRAAAFVEIREGRTRFGALLMTAVPGVSLQNWCAACGDRVDRALLCEVADFVARFHRAGFIHRDLYLSHVFYDESAPQARLHLIDLQRVLRPRVLRRRWIVKDLAALNYSTPSHVATRTDRLRWLRAYLGLRRLDTRAWRLAQSVIRKTTQIARHDRARTARLAGGAESR